MATAHSTGVDYEPAGELKIGQVGIANLRVRTLDVGKLGAEMRDRVTRAPKLFERAAVVVDFGGLSATPDATSARALLLQADVTANDDADQAPVLVVEEA